MDNRAIWGKYGFLWVTLVLFLGSLIGHWVFSWYAYADEQALHGGAVEASGYLIEIMRDTLENWQSEFLQLMWQVGGLAYLYYLGSPQSKEGDDRKEEKLDMILRAVAQDGAQKVQALDAKYGRTK